MNNYFHAYVIKQTHPNFKEDPGWLNELGSWIT